jgi:hypothetical protein
MTWLQPWAWLGVAAVILPIAIHLFGHGPARVVPFPSLRFIDSSRLLPTRRTQLRDPLLLAVRCAILVAATAAVAQPLLGRDQRGVNAGVIARVIVVDTSASMQRRLATGVTALASARTVARALADSTPLHLTVETERVGAAIGPGGDWLRQQPTRGSVVVISDGQRGSIDSGDVAALAGDLGLELITLHPDSSSGPMQWRAATGRGTTLITASGRATRDFVWQWTSGSGPISGVTTLAAAGESDQLRAARDAAHALGVRLPVDTATPVTVVYPGTRDDVTIRRAAQPLATASIAALAARIADDSLLLAAAWNDGSVPIDSAQPAPFVVVAMRRGGGAAVLAAESRVRGRASLLLLVHAAPQSVLSAALLTAVDRARSLAPPPQEEGQVTIDAGTLSRWRRPAPARSALPPGTARDRTSDARWLWVLAMLLLLYEAWLRRRVVGRQVP